MKLINVNGFSVKMWVFSADSIENSWDIEIKLIQIANHQIVSTSFDIAKNYFKDLTTHSFLFLLFSFELFGMTSDFVICNKMYAVANTHSRHKIKKTFLRIFFFVRNIKWNDFFFAFWIDVDCLFSSLKSRSFSNDLLQILMNKCSGIFTEL